MDVVVKGRHTEVTDRFRRHAVEKLSRVDRFDAKVMRIDVEVSEEHNPRLAGECERVEITVRSKGPVVRAEACSDDRGTALDLAIGKLEARLRKAADRRRVHHGGKTPVSVAAATAAAGATPSDLVVEDDAEAAGPDQGESPVVIREKVHEAQPVTLDQALYEMELVGHDFFLFVDATTKRPSVVYRRKGWNYGVIALDLEAAPGPAPDEG
ncbi:SSU ribosomal protein S30P /sigma 54 modulation protein [Motilibacter rhizosphaerae]|uniref:Ribosome hibernation promoting factor n=1 Tax=Motilibacter rhizosphaerae TaxID=598652 RepID=A0A4Q7NSM2_9ACTN|nr:ribosome-associated translation inhibitor RaiA [Motilibacter rhizosphaerae]RZS90136.1 SSU ribosomal protein S30P /sigma 54 modulation protein [Motilibacter rhizosphaerae]